MGIVSPLEPAPAGRRCAVSTSRWARVGAAAAARQERQPDRHRGRALATVAGVGALRARDQRRPAGRHAELFGWTWDYTAESGAAELLADDPSVESVGLVQAGALTIDGRPVTTRGVASLKGELPLTLIEGRPAQAGEVVLGTRTMDDLGVGIGDTVVAGGSLPNRAARRRPRRLRDHRRARGRLARPSRSRSSKLGIEGDSADGAVIARPTVPIERAVQRLEAEGRVEVAEEPLELDRLREVKGFPWC